MACTAWKPQRVKLIAASAEPARLICKTRPYANVAAAVPASAATSRGDRPSERSITGRGASSEDKTPRHDSRRRAEFPVPRRSLQKGSWPAAERARQFGLDRWYIISGSPPIGERPVCERPSTRPATQTRQKSTGRWSSRTQIESRARVNVGIKILRACAGRDQADRLFYLRFVWGIARCPDFNFTVHAGVVLPTGSILTSSIHISPTSISPMILNSRINLRCFGLGLDDSLVLGPAANRLQSFLEASLMERPPGDRRVLVLRDPNAALALGPGGDQIPESQSHLGVVAHGRSW